MKVLVIVFSVIVSFSKNVVAQQPTANNKPISVCLAENEMKLYNLVMQYRINNGLPEIPLSASLTYVAQQHCKDLVNNSPKTSLCNMHSWSSKGNWSSCCYTSDHKAANCMWNKPRELTNYKGNGYEIAFYIWSSANAYYTATPEEALAGWKSSEGHNSVILNKSLWKSAHWNSIGIGIYRGYATIWFGEEKDIEVIPGVCN
jgi:uncharacterized protein YkwD